MRRSRKSRINEELFGIGKNKGIASKIKSLIFENPDNVIANKDSKDLPYLNKDVVTFSGELDGKSLEIEHTITNINKFKITLDGEPVNIKNWDKIEIGNSLQRGMSDTGKVYARSVKNRLANKKEKYMEHLKTFEQFNF